MLLLRKDWPSIAAHCGDVTSGIGSSTVSSFIIPVYIFAGSITILYLNLEGRPLHHFHASSYIVYHRHPCIIQVHCSLHLPCALTKQNYKRNCFDYIDVIDTLGGRWWPFFYIVKRISRVIRKKQNS